LRLPTARSFSRSVSAAFRGGFASERFGGEGVRV
jgi:hypothetical protein